MKSPYEHVSLTPAERESRKKVKREAKNLKKIQREKQRIDNKRRLDHRPEVRMSALLELSAVAAETAPNDHDNNNNITSTPKIDSKDGFSDDSIVAADRVVSLVDLSLSLFSLSLLSYPSSSILELDVSYNCLSDLPGLEALTNLVSLNMRRNEFRVLPPALATLTKLGRLNVSRNQLRPSADLFVLLTQPPLPALEALDLTFNKKLYTQAMWELLRTALPTVVIEMTITSPPPSGAYVGESPGQRNPELLRSQLEPFTTLQLRQRLVETFGYAPYNTYAGTPPAGRATVMASLLTEYKKKTGPNRRLVRSYGVPVPAAVMTGVRQELDAWSERFENQERPMIAASKYMILRSPTEVEEKITRLGSRRAHSAQKKFQQNLSLWKVAKAAMVTVDPDFAEAFTGLAVTKNFRGSPHIDTTNIGPFYGLSTGDFEERTGGVRVELDPMTVCEVNTKDRLGRVDGRYPHWVGPYNPEKTRYSLIFYLTEGVVQPKTTAIFGDIIDDNT
mmetsp:Transcript_27361/g.31093  ORF Transcript_27361/g.31093 Transcript_27361/m.31093 type:complete len:505 (+) Transcript_27361:365-1879(+)